jgi:hypothetical protein
VYITTGGTVATPSPEEGNVKYYDGIAFNDVTDVDEWGRMTIEKSQDFLLKMADQLSFVKEDGKYYIVGEYPEIPEGFEWSLGIGINLKSGARRSFSPATRVQGFDIPREGTFKKDTTGLIDINDVDSINIGISLYNIETNSELGLLNILYVIDGTLRDGTKERANFVPESSLDSRISYTDTFNFEKMFQW